ncbi:EFR1 family ferrodoxin [Paenibacillus faecis]|uniref:EFR1 family ferrodoxin n=1 Tax=Paenibacillus faecis TaxID=862114 RepID=UPI001BCDF1F5|nr:EFR1 family ferrodoxin [Paenibacillus faecis]
MTSMRIFYFSGTGNSLFIAQELHKSFPEATVVPIIQVTDYSIKADVVGFVFPVHAFTMPAPVKYFLEKINLEQPSYLFAIATRGGSPCHVFRDMDRLLQKKERALNAHWFIDMPNNFCHIADTPDQALIERLCAEARVKLEPIAAAIGNREEVHATNSEKSFWRKKLLFPALSVVLRKTDYLHTDKKFYADDRCIGCGLCTKVCLSGKIEQQEGRPVWKEETECYFCFACINYCPRQAIQIRKTKSMTKGRYRHPLYTAHDIARQKGGTERRRSGCAESGEV